MTHHADKRRIPRTLLACAVYYSDGEFHASAVTENITSNGGLLRGTHVVTVGMELVMLVIPPSRNALLVQRATVRWVADSRFGVEVQEADCGPVGELVDEEELLGPLSFMTH